MEATLLSNREYQMVELTEFGLAQKEIANKLRISATRLMLTFATQKKNSVFRNRPSWPPGISSATTS